MTTPSASSARLARDKRLRSQYNISVEDFDEILAYQDFLCAICLEEKTRTGRRKGLPKILNVDHDHKTGLTRGILCVGCNRRIPEWMTIKWLEGVLRYLKNPPATAALGEERYGRKGRVTNKRTRKRRKRK